RSARVPPRIALPFACTVWATIAYQDYATEIRADYLAAAVALSAVAIAARTGSLFESKRVLAAAAACTLAGLAKISSAAVALPIPSSPCHSRSQPGPPSPR